jgi:hypothetical protein
MHKTELFNEQPEPRTPGTPAVEVAAQIAEQRESHATEAAYAAAFEEPSFNKRSGKSNFGSRVAGKIALSRQQRFNPLCVPIHADSVLFELFNEVMSHAVSAGDSADLMCEHLPKSFPLRRVLRFVLGRVVRLRQQPR